MKPMMRRRSASFALVAFLALFTTVCGSGAPQDEVTGEIVETFCWAKIRVGGPAHAACGIACAKRGIPVAIATSREVFILLPGRDKMSVPPELIAQMGQRVTVRGEIVKRAGANFFAVQSWESDQPRGRQQ